MSSPEGLSCRSHHLQNTISHLKDVPKTDSFEWRQPKDTVKGEAMLTAGCPEQLGPFITVTGDTKKGSQLPQCILRSHIRETGQGAKLHYSRDGTLRTRAPSLLYTGPGK